MRLLHLAEVFVLALLAGASTPAQVNPDTCKLVHEDDVATLITLNQSTVEQRDQTSPNQCQWEVKTGLSFIGSEVTLTMKHFDSHAEAVAYMKNELPFYFDKKAPLVKTSGPDDHVDDLMDRPDFAQAEAVHGEYMAKVEANGIEPGARAHPTFEYRLQRMALQAAGATILPSIGLPPDPVRPKAPAVVSDSDEHRAFGPSHFGLAVLIGLVLAVVLGVVLRKALRSSK